MYGLSFSNKALKSLKKIPSADSKHIIDEIEELARNPDKKTNVKRLSNHPIAVFRLRVGTYRVLYNKDDTIRVIDIIDVGHRKDIY